MKKEDLREKTSLLFVSLITDPDYKYDGRSAYRNSDKGYETPSYKELRNNITITSSWSQSQVMVQWSTKEFYK